MDKNGDLITINVRVDIAASSLQAIVENAKKISGTDDKGIYRVDTAEKVNQMISAFLREKNFDQYVKDINNYRS